MNLDGARAVITGAGSGLGRALCLELARHQARVVVSDRDVPSAEETAHQVEQAGGKALVQPCDVTQPDQVEQLAERAFSQLGGVDLLVNNAGVACAGEVGQLPLAEWKRVLDVNLWGVIHGCHTFVPRLRQQGSGHILNISSAAGLISVGYMAPYNVSKAGVVSLSETLYIELKAAGIGVTVACPTFFRTNLAVSAQYTDPKLGKAGSRLVGEARIGPDRVARECLRAVARKARYALPLADGRWAWRLKRLSPDAFLYATHLVQKRLMKESEP
ncbi:SDR family NAD(P)-dependent oxidoreductase [Hyalangium sp.]|uniref:SDR family NAD(P)-dependent oxidoreductase n=1 Tax=Hyalangium sp. TaxID=2028555 RepID=UPI002D240C06|nr:SDR family NAD(P)-dependent oxidoreductase [Hyalangium sp.]HYH95650.1 SDR family NAD(P)-dependent oxidoreductase [Hyalangium sp.]